MFFVKFCKGFVIDYIIKELKNKELRDKTVVYVNSKLDIPNLTEEQEKKLFTGMETPLFDAVEDFLLELKNK